MTISTVFTMKIGEVNHHLLQSVGNAAYENYGTTVEDWPYINIAQSENSKWLRVKFLAPANTGIKYYLWNFGDGTTLKTINREVVHRYNLTNKADWMTNTGVIPVSEFGLGYGLYQGKWASVVLTAVSYDNRIATSSTTVAGCIYEIIDTGHQGSYEFGDGSIEFEEGSIEL